MQSRPVKKLPALRGRTVVNIFFEDSTRTRTSFEIAGKWLSADTINVSAKGSSVSKGESLRDTMLTLDAMGVDAFVIRHSSSGAAAPGGRLGEGAGDQRRRRPARAPHPGAAGRLLDAPALPRRSASRAAFRGQADRHRRRPAALPGGAQQRAAAAHARRRGGAGRAADPAADRRGDLGLPGDQRLRLGARRGRHRDDAARAARADGRRLLPDRARVHRGLRAHRGAAGRDEARRGDLPPRPDEPRRGDLQRGRGRRQLPGPRPGRRPASRSG